MILTNYIDIELFDSKSAQTLSSLFVALHTVYERVGGFALDFPLMRCGEDPWMGSKIRVFTGSHESIDALVSLLEENSAINGKVRFMFAKKVPPDFKGSWVQHSRFRIPTALDIERSRTDKKKIRINRMLEKNLPFFRVFSQSTKQLFSLSIHSVRGQGSSVDVFPTSYGLSSHERPFSVPVIR